MSFNRGVRQLATDNGGTATQEQIRQMEQELSKMEYKLYEEYCEVGKVILEKAERENRKINCLVDQIIETRRKLAEAKQEKCCPECAGSNDHNSLYCNRCGARLLETDYEEDYNGTG